MQGILAGRYRLDRQLGKGGMGSVWLAEHLTLNSWVAVKLMDPSIASTAEGAERFKREAQAAASLRSAHVVQVLDYGVHETTPFLVMELLQGQSLADCIEREKRLTPERTVTIITQVARAIGRAHAGGIVHRDLKPDNIFLVREDDQELAKVLDFGIAKTTGPRFGGMETRTGVTMGTPYYMSPEQVEGKKALDHRSDLWSLAVIACECMTGVRPFDGETFGELLLNICARPVLPPSSQGFFLPGFDEWFAKATNRDRDLRFSSAQELAATLADVVAGRALIVAPATGPQATLPMGQQAAATGPHATLPLRQDSTVLGAVVPTHSGALIPRHPGTGGSTASALTASVPMQRRGVLPIALGGLAVLGIAAALLVKLGGGKHDAPSSGPAPAVDLASANAQLGAGPAPVVVSPLPTDTVANDPGTKPGAKPAVRAPVAEKVAPADKSSPPTSAPNQAAGAAPSAPAAAAAAHAPRLERCFADPFTGQVRLAGAGHAADSFPCRQNAFTGAYQRQ